jgi:hypothetical protein
VTNKHARFCFNNAVESGGFETSSAQSAYPASNLVSGIRGKVWKANGLFAITASNNQVYINGSTFTVAVGNYTAATLITAFNSATSQTLSRNSEGRFVITLGSSGTLNLSTTTDAIWATLGFLTSTDLSGTVFTANERRYNNGEWIKVDYSIPQAVTFAAMIPPNESVFSCTTGTLRLQANNVDDWTNPPLNVAMEVSSKGAFAANDIPDDPAELAYRYWRIYIEDVRNPEISASVVYIGDSVIPQFTNVATGFNINLNDPSTRLYSESGQLYVERRPRLATLDSCSVQFLKGEDLANMKQLFYDLGTGRPFFICIDPKTQVSPTLSDLAFYVQVEDGAQFSHVLASYYNLSFSLREVI